MKYLKNSWILTKTRLIEGEDVLISGFAEWIVKSKGVRSGRNLQTGSELLINALRVVTWKYSPVMKAQSMARQD
jgi:integration host factor subunit alpha